jgi:hypothetical protein
VINSIQAELLPIQDCIATYQSDPKLISQSIHEGSAKARSIAQETMAEAREVMGITY